MAISYRYPNTIENSNAPWVIFSTFTPNYDSANKFRRILDTTTGESVALYIPQNVSVNDSIRYENGSLGFAGALLERWQDGTVTNVSKDDMQAVSSAFSRELAAAAGAGLGAIGGGTVGAGLGAIGGIVGVGNLSNTISQVRQRVLNPREYKLFNAPAMRQFSFNFTFIPSNENEASQIPEIIKFFRSASYPRIHPNKIDYIFPNMFRIQFNDRGGFENKNIIKLPEVVCSSVQVTYNPNSISFYRQNDMPVEITLALTFEELKPIDRTMVEEGF